MSTVNDLPPTAEPVHPIDSIHGSIWTGEQDAQIAWWVHYDEVDAFAQAVYGSFESISYGGGSMIRRVPLIHPRYPALIAKEIDVQLDGYREDPPDYFDRYTLAKITVEFSIPPYNNGGPVPYAAFQRLTSVGTLTVPGFQAVYESTGRPIQQDLAVPLTTYDLAVTIFNMQVANPTGIAAAESAPLNSEPFVTPRGPYPPGTVLFTSMSEQAQAFTGGFTTYQCTLQFRVCPALRWDYRALPYGLGVDRIVRPDGSAIIPMSDLNAIFAF